MIYFASNVTSSSFDKCTSTSLCDDPSTDENDEGPLESSFEKETIWRYEFPQDLEHRGIDDSWKLPKEWKSLADPLSEERTDLTRFSNQEHEEMAEVVWKSWNKGSLVVGVMSNIVRFRKLLRNKEVGDIANAQWADVPLAAPWGWMPRQIPAPCPDITVGLNTSAVNYAAEIRSLEPYACPVIKDSFILFPVITLEVRGIPHGMFYLRSQNLYNGAVMLRNLRELHSTARGEESCVKDFDHKVFVLTISISVDTVEINIHFTEVEGGVLTFKSAMMDIWLTQSPEDIP